MSEDGEKQYDIIVFGATGYTGKYVVEELAKMYAKHNLKWAVAGRNLSKLKACLAEVQRLVGDDDFVQNVGIVVADVEDKDSVYNMCGKTKLLLNCTGPYLFYGEAIIQACVAKGTHHIDISGEFKYLEETQAKYFQDARDKGIYIVQACGYDSIPADVGTATLKKKFNGKMKSVEIFTKFEDGPEGKTLNIGTWMSSVHSMQYIFQIPKIRQCLKEKVFTKKMLDYNQSHFSSFPLSYYGREKKWCVSLPAPDVPVLQRSQMFGAQFFDEIPIPEIKVFLSVSSFIRALGVLFLVSIVGGLSFFSFGRYLLGKFPGFFSFGYFTNQGPTREQVINGSVIVTLCGRSDDSGESGKTDDETAPLLHSTGGVKTLGLKITGPDAAYALTSICMVHSGIVVLEEADKMPLEKMHHHHEGVVTAEVSDGVYRGGVLTPGVAFVNTTLISRLKERGIKFEWIKE